MADFSVAMQYAEAVRRGDQVVNKWVRLAVERHFKDLETGHERGLWFDEEAAQHVIDFCGFCSHFKGEWAGCHFEPEPWQQFLLWVLFGWMNEDGTRRFRTSYLEIARKNGKTFVGGAVGLYLCDPDGEPGAEIYTAATKRDQARLCHRDATQMVKASPLLRRRFNINKDNLHVEETASKFEPLGRDSDSTDGLNVHGAILDEIHAWKTRDLFDVIETATGARRQPLLFGITTAGFNRQSLCFELHEYLQKILDGIIEDDSFFGLIFSMDEGDDWKDEKNWVKSNPNLGVSVKIDDLRRKAKKAQETPAALNAFLRLHLNIWTQAETRWLDADKWRACSQVVDPAKLRGRRCYGGLDLSSTTDVSAWVKVFPPEREDEPYYVICNFFIPEDNMHERSRRDRVPYDAFVRQGYLATTPGTVIDYSFILDQIDRDAQDYDLMEVAFDRWGATKIIQELEELGLTVVQFGQGFASMSPPMKELETMILSQKIAHGGNPVLSWMADNVVARQDPAGNIKPDKSKSVEKIDGIVALIMGLDRALHGLVSVVGAYQERGIRCL